MNALPSGQWFCFGLVCLLCHGDELLYSNVNHDQDDDDSKYKEDATLVHLDIGDCMTSLDYII